MKKLDEIKIQLVAIEALQTMKKLHTHRQLSKILKLPIPVISRYVNGHVLPSVQRAEFIITKFSKIFLPKLLMENLTVLDKERKLISIENLISDVGILSLVSKVVFMLFKDFNVSKVLTKEGVGLPFATLVAKQFNANLLVARTKKEIGVDNVLEVRRYFEDGTYSYLYIPKALLKKGENVLLVNDFNRTGSTMKALIEACRIRGANLVGATVLINIQTPAPSLGTKFVFFLQI